MYLSPVSFGAVNPKYSISKEGELTVRKITVVDEEGKTIATLGPQKQVRCLLDFPTDNGKTSLASIGAQHQLSGYAQVGTIPSLTSRQVKINPGKPNEPTVEVLGPNGTKSVAIGHDTDNKEGSTGYLRVYHSLGGSSTYNYHEAHKLMG